MSQTVASSRRLIVKIGSSLLVDEATGEIRRPWLEALIEDVVACRKRGQQVLIVTSGAVAVGRRPLGLAAGPLRLEEKQAAASAGQLRLAHAYQDAAARFGVTVAQILLTPDDTEARRRHLNARATIEQLLNLKALPVINENDTVATAEIRFGDNDRLAARVAQMISADTLVLLSDIDGLYTSDPRRDPKAKHIAELREISAETDAMAERAPPGSSSGGMVTKLAAARIALAAGCRMAIAKGTDLHPLAAIDKGARATWFIPSAEPLTARKRWIAGAVNFSGALVVDDGAAAALKRGTSLLPAGVSSVEGSFERGDAVVVRSKDSKELARGLSAYSSEDARAIAGHKSGEIEAILGYRGRDEMIHRDDLVLT